MTEAEGKSSAIKKTTVIACNGFVFVCLPVQPLDGKCSLRSQQACLSILLRLDDRIDQDNIENFPLAQYAAQYWAIHARFENASSHIKNGMECLLDADKPYFAMWLGFTMKIGMMTPVIRGLPCSPRNLKQSPFNTL